MNVRHYTNKKGEQATYVYDYAQYYKEYNAKRNQKIYCLQKRKYYYKKTGQLDKVKAIEAMIAEEKRKAKLAKD